MLNPDQWLLDDQEHIAPLAKWQKTVNLMAQLFNAPAGYIVQHCSRGYQVSIASEQPENPYSAGTLIAPSTNIFCRRVVETRQELYVSNAGTLPEWASNPEVADDGFESYLGVPIFWPDGTAFGTICVMDYKVTGYDNTYVELIRQFRDIVQTDLLLVQQYEQIRHLAMQDELTGLMNRRGFMTLAEQRIKLARYNKEALGLVYLDMDGLKGVNDRFGHQHGDEALRALANCLRQHTRDDDLVARIGGDEFIVMTRLKDPTALNRIGERILDSLPDTLPEDLNGQCGISFGTALMNNLNRTLESWLADADKAMYQQKRHNKQTDAVPAD